MATRSPSADPSAGAPTRVTRALADELRTILDLRGAGHAQSLISAFVARHGMTHRDVDTLLVALAQDDVADAAAVTLAAPTVDGAAHGDATTDESVAAAIETEEAGTSAGRNGPADESDTDAPGDDLSWMFAEEPDSMAPRAAADIVGQALDDLLGDWSRTGGQLTLADVAVLCSKRGLSPAQHVELVELLEEAGVDLPDPTRPGPWRATPEGFEHQRDAVGQYLRAIGRYPLIDGSRERELWSLISQGAAARETLDSMSDDELAPHIRQSLRTLAVAGRQAHAELVCANLRLVLSIAKARRYEFSGVEFADRIQDGNIGLMRAAEKFDGSKGFKFSTYATWWIRQSIERGIGDRGRLIRIPIHLHEQFQKVGRAVSQLTARLDRAPTLTEISDATDIEPGKVQAALDLMRPIRSLDELLGDEGDLRLSDVLARDEDRDGRMDPAEIVVQATFRTELASALRTLLPDRAAWVIERRFGLGTGDEETLEDIGADCGVTRERIRQIQGAAMKRLSVSKEIATLRTYLVDDSKADWSGSSAERRAS